MFSELTKLCEMAAALGYQTVDHLPINRGWDSHVGYFFPICFLYYYLFSVEVFFVLFCFSFRFLVFFLVWSC